MRCALSHSGNRFAFSVLNLSLLSLFCLSMRSLCIDVGVGIGCSFNVKINSKYSVSNIMSRKRAWGMVSRAVRGSRQGNGAFSARAKINRKKPVRFVCLLSAACCCLLLCALLSVSRPLSRSYVLLRLCALFECAAAFVWGAAQSQQNCGVCCAKREHTNFVHTDKTIISSVAT